MSKLRLTQRAENQMDEIFWLEHRAIDILEVVVAEWSSDPQSVQCFDLRIVEEAKNLMARLNHLEYWTRR